MDSLRISRFGLTVELPDPFGRSPGSAGKAAEVWQIREFIGEFLNKCSMPSSLRDLEAASKPLRLEGEELSMHSQRPGIRE